MYVKSEDWLPPVEKLDTASKIVIYYDSITEAMLKGLCHFQMIFKQASDSLLL